MLFQLIPVILAFCRAFNPQTTWSKQKSKSRCEQEESHQQRLLSTIIYVKRDWCWWENFFRRCEFRPFYCKVLMYSDCDSDSNRSHRVRLSDNSAGFQVWQSPDGRNSSHAWNSCEVSLSITRSVFRNSLQVFVSSFRLCRMSIPQRHEMDRFTQSRFPWY